MRAAAEAPHSSSWSAGRSRCDEGGCRRLRSSPSRWCRGQDQGREFSGQSLQLVVGDVVIAPDRLDVIIFLERVNELHELRRIISTNFDFGRRPPRELRAFAFAEHRLERLGDLMKA